MATIARLIYTPEGGSKQSWEFDAENPPWDLTYGTEKATGWPWGEFWEKLSQSSVIALQAMLWTLRKRSEPRLAMESIQVLFAEVDLEIDDPEPEDAEDPKES